MKPSEGSPALEAQNVSFAYASPVVQGFSLSLEPGGLTGVIGPNGCGKTTVLRLLDGILRPHSGEIRLHGRHRISTMPRKEVARHVAMVPQSPGMYEYQTVLQFAMQGRSPHLSLLGFESQKDEEITREALEMTQLSGYLNARVSEISGGEKQRLLLARSLAQRTEILLLDEFTANLDINYQVELMRLVARITHQNRLATLVVSHEINLLSAFADRVVLMSRGSVFRQGGVQEVLTRENLRQLFGIDFTIRQIDGVPEIVPHLRPDRDGHGAEEVSP
jgi:iron complex transport system ATP-binding protein